MKIIILAATLAVAASAATAQVGSTLTQAPTAPAQDIQNGGEGFYDLFTDNGIIKVVINRGDAALAFSAGTMSNIGQLCQNGGMLSLAIGDGIPVTVDGRNVVVGGVDSGYNCPIDSADQPAYAFTEEHFTDRLHDKTFFTEGDREQMLEAIADGKRLTGPEFFDGFTVHTHDGVAIDKVFADSRSNVMAYRFISSDGRRAYIAIDRSDLLCGNSCTIGGAEVIYFHASKKTKGHVHHTPKPPVDDIGELPTITCRTCTGG